MRKRAVKFLAIILFLLACSVIVNCNSSNKRKNGYVNETEILIEEKTNTILAIDRTFYRKLPTIHNGLIEIKQPDGEPYIVVVVNGKDLKNFSLFVIEDFHEFLENAKVVMNDSNQDITLSIDDLKSTYMRKSVSFEKGVFIQKETNNTSSVIFDLSKQDLKEIEEAYNLLLNE